MTIGQFLFALLALGCVSLFMWALWLMWSGKALLLADFPPLNNVGTEENPLVLTEAEQREGWAEEAFFNQRINAICCAAVVEIATHLWLDGELTDKQFADEVFAAVSDTWE